MYEYEGKYLDGSTQLYIPARIPEAQTELIRQAAVKAYRALDCRGLSRVDFFALHAEDRLTCGETYKLMAHESIYVYRAIAAIS